MTSVASFLLFLLFSQPAWSLCVMSDVANLRSGPGVQYKKTWTVGKYMPLLKVGEKSGWYKVVDLDGESHWISSSLVTTRVKCLVVSSRKSILRSGPGTHFSNASYKQADKYTPFKRVTKKEAWYHVSDVEGNRFWIHESNIWRPVRVSNISF